MQKILLLFSILAIIIIPVLAVKAQVTQSELIISEVMPNPIGTDNLYEWVEIVNVSAQSIDLSEWAFEGVGLPAISIDPNQYIILARDKGNFLTRYDVTNEVIQQNFALNNSGATLNLQNIITGVQNQFTYASAAEEISFELLSGGCEIIQMHPTSNSVGVVNTSCISLTPTITPTLSPIPTTTPNNTSSNKIIIDQIMPSPESGSEWLSLKNIDNQIVVLDNWYLTDATNKKYTIADLTIEPEQSKQIYPSTISLNNDGDIITLYNDQGVQLDIFSYSDSAKGQIISNSPVVTGSIIPSISVNSNSSNYLVNKVVTSAPTIKLEIPQIYYLGEY